MSTGARHKAPLFGAVMTGFLASACCLGPLIVVLLGIGSASAFIALEPYRPIFATITIGLLGRAGWRHWQGKRQCAARNRQSGKPVLLWALGGLAILLLVSPLLLPWIIRGNT